MPAHGPPVPSARDGSRVGWVAVRRRRGSRSAPRASAHRTDRIPRRADCTILAFADEIENLVHEGMIVELARHVLDPLGQGALIGKKQAIGAADVVNLFAGEAATAQADDVETG